MTSISSNVLSKQILTREDVLVMKGIAILWIMLHNYCHRLSFAVGQNEFRFSSKLVWKFFNSLRDTPLYCPVHIVSYFGHYGVGVFVFLSGYGLAMKYADLEALNTLSGRLKVMFQHILKLLTLFVVGYCWFAIDAMLLDGRWRGDFFDKRFMWEMSMCANLRFVQPFQILRPGVYWYFSLCAQLYLVYFFVLQRIRPIVRTNVFILIVLLLEIIAYYRNPFPFNLLSYLRTNCIGWIPQFLIGVYSKNVNYTISRRAVLVFFILSPLFLILSELSFIPWLFAPFLAIIFCYSSVIIVLKRIYAWLHMLGSISSSIFIVHPTIRAVLLRTLKHQYVYHGIFIYTVVVIQCSKLNASLIQKVIGIQHDLMSFLFRR